MNNSSAIKNLKVAQLREMATGLGIENANKKTKTALLKELQEIAGNNTSGNNSRVQSSEADDRTNQNASAAEKYGRATSGSSDNKRNGKDSNFGIEQGRDEQGHNEQGRKENKTDKSNSGNPRNDTNRKDKRNKGKEQAKNANNKNEKNRDANRKNGSYRYASKNEESDFDSDSYDSQDDNDYIANEEEVLAEDIQNEQANFVDNETKKITRKRTKKSKDEKPMTEIEEIEEDEIYQVAGILDIKENYGFIRTESYLASQSDIYVSPSQIKKLRLRQGDMISGLARRSHGLNKKNSRQKFSALIEIQKINNASVEESFDRPKFNDLTPLYPNERLLLENNLAAGTHGQQLTSRLIDLISPIGKGQRGLIVSPPKAGKTILMQQIANAITENNPEVYLMVVLVDERPEEVTDMERNIRGEVISSTFDKPVTDHTTVAELAIEHAKRLVEMGRDVVILLDSMTRLARAYNLATPASGRILSGGVDSTALYPPKKFFGAARNIENGGSLTIIASALIETGSKMDEVIFEEFKGTGNMEIRLSRELADKRIFPAIDVNASGTRREELLLDQNELALIYKLRRLLGGLEEQQALETLLAKIKKTKNNIDFLLDINKTMPSESAIKKIL